MAKENGFVRTVKKTLGVGLSSAGGIMIALGFIELFPKVEGFNQIVLGAIIFFVIVPFLKSAGLIST